MATYNLTGMDRAPVTDDNPCPMFEEFTVLGAQAENEHDLVEVVKEFRSGQGREAAVILSIWE